MNSKELERKISESSRVSASAEQISSDLGGEAVILNLKTGIYHGLNEVGAQVWTLIQEPKTVFEIKQTLLHEYEVEADVCERDLMILLQELVSAGLIEVKDETNR
jgi:Coenzyme PQQ synthesis protein D (PqqD)